MIRSFLLQVKQFVFFNQINYMFLYLIVNDHFQTDLILMHCNNFKSTFCGETNSIFVNGLVGKKIPVITIDPSSAKNSTEALSIIISAFVEDLSEIRGA